MSGPVDAALALIAAAWSQDDYAEARGGTPKDPA